MRPDSVEDTSAPITPDPGLRPPSENDVANMNAAAGQAPLSTNVTDQFKPDEEAATEEESPSPEAAKPSALDRMMGLLKPKSSAPITLDLGQGIDRSGELDKALASQRNAQLAGQLGKASQLLGSGVSGAIGGGMIKAPTPQGEEMFNDIEKSGDTALKQYQIKKDAEKDDPNSPLSKAFKQYAKQFGINVKGDFTASMAEKLMPYAFKAFEAQESRNAKHEDLGLKYAQLKQSKEESATKKAGDAQDKAMQQTKQLLESARGNPAAAQAERDIYAASKANSLANLYGNPDKLSPQMVQMLASELAKIAQGGAPTMHELEGLTPNTLASKFASVVQPLINHPTPANAGKFIKQYQDYANALTKDAQKVIKDKYGRVIESAKKQVGPENYDTLQRMYSNRFDTEEESNDSPSHAPGSIVQIKGKNYRVGADGDSLEEMK